MNRPILRLALVVAILLALPFVASTSAADSTAGRFCYVWSFLNSTAADADGLQARFQGVQELNAIYAGSLNPFGDPLPASGYNPKFNSYFLQFAGGTIYAGDQAGIGFCTGSSSARTGGTTTPASWWLGSTAVEPAPLLIGARWIWSSSMAGQIQLFNDRSEALTLLSASLLDPGGGGAALALDDLTQDAAAGLTVLQELIAEPLSVSAGASTLLSFFSGAGGASRPLVAEIVYASDGDPDNVARLYMQASTPVPAYLPLVLR